MSNPHVLVVDDEADIRVLIKDILTDESYDVTSAADASEARAARAAQRFDLVLLDIWMPDTDGITLLREWSDGGELNCPVVIMSGHGTVDTAVEATRLGAFDFVEKPLSLAKLLRTVEAALESAGRQSPAARKLLPSLLAPVGRSALMQGLRERVQQYARHDGAVLISGEPGTGRSAFARYMHGLSRRGGEALTTLTAATITDSNCEEQLLGSELGGEVVAGAFERAAGGTLVIDELADLTENAQRILFGALESGRFTRVGGSEPIRLDARIVATVSADYEDRVEAGQLRRDLVSHLGELKLRVPPLRDYSEDVPELLTYYVDKLVDSEGLTFRRFSVAAQNRLRNYPWPDNVHELKNLVRRLLLSGSDEDIGLEEVEAEIAAASAADEPLVKQDLLALPLREAREQFERAYLQQQLVLCGGKVGQLAKRVGMERTHLYRKLRSLGVDFKSVTSDD
ncbi:MAG: sigma-54 dependent transcriptional regulator [Gammaproteobacteria bacterium]|nr:sigma-54 dependent transcriptional regulator [Gammaproteobacteria bacterium]MBT8104411.1 sigma-54 dependent transcriptional regulator [Gammaproteobacteria bacterium]NNF50535.1 sigma-54-dependent Fis family transcriptional regulator [Woeseiaceae bacterium]NNK24427.1 sigma-54-dependent Fis family transcriptional regulator [Woeseiaceae bacterium]NNL62847.1 sigma-54-dependent Fis family transcriptional regulator [Woeseiaceae bacterium]